jgi:hypothetical protein
MLRASKLLVMEKYIGDFHPIAVGEVFLQLINHSIILLLRGPFQKHISPD